MELRKADTDASPAMPRANSASAPRSVKPFATRTDEGPKESSPDDGGDAENDRDVVGGVVRISVKDSGAGLAPRDLARLFQEGVQINANKLQGGGGSGFGLFITKGIVTQHNGGRIWCESKGEGTGCAFLVELPVVDVAQLPPEEARWVRKGCNPWASALNSVANSPAHSSKSPRSLRSPRLPAPVGADSAATPTHAKVLDEVSAALAATTSQAPLLCTLPKNLHVLVVDDSDMNRKVS